VQFNVLQFHVFPNLMINFSFSKSVIMSVLELSLTPTHTESQQQCDNFIKNFIQYSSLKVKSIHR
jgi:hypothetical protein